MNKQSNDRFENEEYSKKKINKKFKSVEKDKIVDVIGYRVTENKLYNQKNKQKKFFIRYKKKFHKNFQFLNKKCLQLQYKVDQYKFKDYKAKLDSYEELENRELDKKKTKPSFLFSRQRKNSNANFLETLFASNFLESQDDIKPFLYNYYSPTSTSVSFKQLFSLIYIITSRVKSRRIYMYSDQQKVLEFLSLLISEGKINNLIKVGKDTELKNWLLTKKKDRVLISLSNNVSNNFYSLILKKNILLSYYVNGFYDSIKKLAVGSYFLRNDLMNDFKKIMFFLQFMRKSAKMYVNKNLKKSERRIRFFQGVNRRNIGIKRNLKTSLSKLYLNRYKLRRFFKLKFRDRKFYTKNK